MYADCYRHPGRPTALSCTRCGRPACPECLRPAPVGQHCVDCVAQEAASARVPAGATPTALDAYRTPWVTYSLIAINVVLFVAAMMQSRGDLNYSTIMREGWLHTGNPFGQGYEYWRLLTSGFLHFSVPHLLVNMISLYILGRDLERLFGWSRYLMIYLISLFGGSAAVLALQHSEAATAGASGAIYGLMGALLVVVLRLKLPATSVLVVIGINIVMSLSIPGISLWAHLGGLLFGALGALAVLWLPVVTLAPAQRTEAAAGRIGWIGLTVLLVIAVGAGVGLMTAMS